jgi:HSP20 family protein
MTTYKIQPQSISSIFDEFNKTLDWFYNPQTTHPKQQITNQQNQNYYVTTPSPNGSTAQSSTLTTSNCTVSGNSLINTISWPLYTDYSCLSPVYPVTDTYIWFIDTTPGTKNSPKIAAPEWPLANLYTERDGTYVLEVAVTGFSKEDIKIERENQRVRIKVEDKKEDSERVYFYKKVKVKGFDETFTFSEEHDMDNIKITFSDGILKVSVPMKEEHKPIVKQLMIE